MSNLEQNTLNLQIILNTANLLPDANSGVELPNLTNPGSASDLLSGKQLIGADGNVVTGNIATKTASNLSASGATVTVPAGYYDSQATKSVSTATQATPSISINSSGLITATATQTAGYVSAGTKSGTKQLTTQAAKTITPTTTSQTAVASGRYTTEAVTVAGDSNLVASNIKSGVSIFGVNGSYEGSGGGGSVETCMVEIFSNGNSYYPANVAYTSVDSSGKVIGVNQTVSAPSVTVTCVKGSTLAVKYKKTVVINATLINANLLFYTSPIGVYKLDDNATTATIKNFASGGSAN